MTRCVCAREMADLGIADLACPQHGLHAFITASFREREPRIGDAGDSFPPRPATDHGRSPADAVLPRFRRRGSSPVGVPLPELTNAAAASCEATPPIKETNDPLHHPHSRHNDRSHSHTIRDRRIHHDAAAPRAQAAGDVA